MRAAFYDDPEYKKKQSSITKAYWKSGRFDFKRFSLVLRECSNPNCKSKFNAKPYDSKRFCSKSCSVTINNSKRFVERPKCLDCNKEVKRKPNIYCSSQCQNNFNYSEYIKQWKLGFKNGNTGITTKFLSNHIKHYLQVKYGGICSKCGWNKKHSLTLNVPLEVNHIDGNANNNNENNLELLCPNCHSLTLNFKGLNRGNGRA